MEMTLSGRDPIIAPSTLHAWLIRALDLAVAGLGLVLLLPLLGLLALAVRFSSPGPVLYGARRVGRHGRLFTLYKFRSMRQGADRQGPGVTLAGDSRVTPLGRLLRRYKLDELPQLFNVLRGDMSLVGPRPEDPRYVALYSAEQRQVLRVRPGITSAASVYYREEETLLQGENWETIYFEQILPRKLAAELAYLQRRTVWSDLGLILHTGLAVLHGGQRLDVLLALRNRHFLLLDLLLLLLLPALAMILRLDGLDWWPAYHQSLIVYTLVATLIKLPLFYHLDLYRRYWRLANVNDLVRVGAAVGLATLVIWLLFSGAQPALLPYRLAIPRTIPIIDGLLTLLAVGGSRFGLRALYHWRQRRHAVLGGRRVLIVGAGEAGTLAVREVRANPQLDLEAVAFIDDDPAKIGTRVQGLPVLGRTADIARLVAQYQFQRIVVALPSAPLKRQQEVMRQCRQTGAMVYNLPGVYELLAGTKSLSHFPQVEVNQLLHRPPVVTDAGEVAVALAGRTVLVTGAGGSIGGELCRQIAGFEPARLILLGHGENSIFEIGLNLRLDFPHLVTHPVIVDVRDARRVNQVVEKYRPRVIFHAAAHKHVPFMEENLDEAISNNVLGTRNVLRAAEIYGVEQFVLISTDKAINPTSIMGATKAIAELLVRAAAQRSGRAYMAVRFGNVLGSRGSVTPIFQQQIAAGGPLTLTHPEMTRYFMTIPEAVQLVLQATVLGQGGEIFVLDMGRPVRILDLALDLIRLSGLEPERDIQIVYSGIRPGEKLNEELFLAGEAYQRTRHQTIFRATQTARLEVERLESAVSGLINLSQQAPPPVVLRAMQDILPEYQPYPLPAAPPPKPRRSPPRAPVSPSPTTGAGAIEKRKCHCEAVRPKQSPSPG